MLVEFSVIPIGAGPDVRVQVAQVVDMIDKSGLPYQVTATSTIIEGEWDQVMPLLRKCLDEVRRSAPRVLAMIKIDDEAGLTHQLEANVRVVEEMLGRRPPQPTALAPKMQSR